jgi:hypothetical protein
MFVRRLGKLCFLLLVSVIGVVSMSSTKLDAASDEWRSWTDIESGSYAVVFGTPAYIYECFNGKFPMSLQYRDTRGRWKNMQTVTTKKSKLCDGGYAALFKGKVTQLGKRLDDGLYLEMRMSSAASAGFRAFRSSPALVYQYKSRREQIRDLGKTLQDVLLGL